MSLSLSAQRELRGYINELEELSTKPQPHMTAEARRQHIDFLKVKISALKSGVLSDELRNAEVDELLKECNLPVPDRTASAVETRKTREFLRSMESGREYRTYVPMNTTESGTGAGGFVIPANFYRQITSMLAATDVLFDPKVVTFYESDNGSALPCPIVSDEGSQAVTVSENSDGGELEITLGQLLLDKAPTWRSKKIVGTLEWLTDENFPIDTVLSNIATLRFRRGISAANISTLVTQASGAVTPVAAGAADLVTLDDIENLLANINSEYVSDPSFRVLMNQSTLSVLLKEIGSDNRYQSGVIRYSETAQAYTVFGKVIAVSPSVASPAASAVPVIAGAMKFWLQRVVRNSLTMLRYTNAPGLAENALVAYEFFIRANGGLLQLGSGSPVQVLQNPAS
jgi:HK97 family phage major capsid protein